MVLQAMKRSLLTFAALLLSAALLLPAALKSTEATSADLTGTLDIPSHKTELNVYLRNLSNLEFSEKAMSAPNALDKIGGTVNAAFTFNGKAVVTAFGPLADGRDMDLQPGDQVKFRYVKSGKLIETDFRTAEKDLQELANPRR